MPVDLTPLFSRPLTEEELRAARRGTTVSGQASETERRAIAEAHGLASLEALSYEARLEPYGRHGWRLEGRLHAEFAQTCVVTLDPVETSLDEPILRLWSPDAPEDGASADVASGRTDWTTEIPELADADEPDAASDDAFLERTPNPIDPAQTALEVLTLSLDPYPRAPGVAFEGAIHSPPGAAPLTDEAARPFAGLQALRDATVRSAASSEEPAAGPDSNNTTGQSGPVREEHDDGSENA